MEGWGLAWCHGMEVGGIQFLLLVLTFLITVLLFFLFLQASLFLLLLLEQPLLQLPLLIGLKQQIGEWAGGFAGGARSRGLRDWCTGAELLLGEVLPDVLLIQQGGPEPHLLITEVFTPCRGELHGHAWVDTCMCMHTCVHAFRYRGKYVQAPEVMWTRVLTPVLIMCM